MFYNFWFVQYKYLVFVFVVRNNRVIKKKGRVESLPSRQPRNVSKSYRLKLPSAQQEFRAIATERVLDDTRAKSGGNRKST